MKQIFNPKKQIYDQSNNSKCFKTRYIKVIKAELKHVLNMTLYCLNIYDTTI